MPDEITLAWWSSPSPRLSLLDASPERRPLQILLLDIVSTCTGIGGGQVNRRLRSTREYFKHREIVFLKELGVNLSHSLEFSQKLILAYFNPGSLRLNNIWLSHHCNWSWHRLGLYDFLFSDNNLHYARVCCTYQRLRAEAEQLVKLLLSTQLLSHLRLL